MFRPVVGFFTLLLLCPSCKKEDVKEYHVRLHASCYDCVVQYAAGPDRGRYDTLAGSVVGSDTLRATEAYTLTMREDEALFFRACRLDPDSGRFGSIDLQVDGDIQPLSVQMPREADCAVLNQEVQFN